MRMFRQNPDVIALALLAPLLVAPAVLSAHPPRAGTGFRIHSASLEEVIAMPPGPAEGMEGAAEWTVELERRGERVWQRLAERMRQFEERFERYSNAPPRLHQIDCDTASE